MSREVDYDAKIAELDARKAETPPTISTDEYNVARKILLEAKWRKMAAHTDPGVAQQTASPLASMNEFLAGQRDLQEEAQMKRKMQRLACIHNFRVPTEGATAPEDVWRTFHPWFVRLIARTQPETDTDQQQHMCETPEEIFQSWKAEVMTEWSNDGIKQNTRAKKAHAFRLWKSWLEMAGTLASFKTDDATMPRNIIQAGVDALAAVVLIYALQKNEPKKAGPFLLLLQTQWAEEKIDLVQAYNDAKPDTTDDAPAAVTQATTTTAAARGGGGGGIPRGGGGFGRGGGGHHHGGGGGGLTGRGGGGFNRGGGAPIIPQWVQRQQLGYAPRGQNQQYAGFRRR
jgi:hypothetical protein